MKTAKELLNEISQSFQLGRELPLKERVVLIREHNTKLIAQDRLDVLNTILDALARGEDAKQVCERLKKEVENDNR